MTILLSILLPLLAMADDPSQHLPNGGAGCTYRESFRNGMRSMCGMQFYQLYSCQDSDYLVVGHYGAFNGGVCSPTLEVDNVVPQAKPQK